MTGRDRILVEIADCGSASALARLLGTSAALVCMWKDGRRRPGLPMALRLEAALGISPRSWLTDEEQAAVDSAAWPEEE